MSEKLPLLDTTQIEKQKEIDEKKKKTPKNSPRPLGFSLTSLFKSQSQDVPAVKAIISNLMSSKNVNSTSEELSPRSQEILDEKQIHNKSGWLFKRGAEVKSWKHRYFVLHGIYFIYFASDKNIQKEKGTINIHGVSVENSPPSESFEGQKFIIQIHQKERVYYLSAENLQDYIHWGNLLRKNSLYFDGKTLKVSKYDSSCYPTIEEAVIIIFFHFQVI
jgi:hypothetical protein